MVNNTHRRFFFYFVLSILSNRGNGENENTAKVEGPKRKMQLFHELESILDLDSSRLFLSDECESLQKVYDGLEISQTRRNGSDCCKWYNTCCENGKIIGISFINSIITTIVLSGTISEAINDLTDLRSIFIKGFMNSDVHGTIPPLDNLKELTQLRIDNLALTGTIPNLSMLTDLRDFTIYNNFLTGSIPNLQDLTKLEQVDLSFNSLVGPVPNLGNSTNLEKIDLSFNRLTGFIPESYGALPLLREFDVTYNNAIIGKPSFLCDIENFQYDYSFIDDDTCV